MRSARCPGQVSSIAVWLSGFASAHFLESTNHTENLAEKALHALESKNPAPGQALKVCMLAVGCDSSEVMELPCSPGQVVDGWGVAGHPNPTHLASCSYTLSNL